MSLPPATKLRQGDVFTHICHSVHRGVYQNMHRGRHPPWANTPWADTPLGRHPPWADTPRTDNPLGRHTPWADTPWAVTPLGRLPGRHPPALCMLGYGQQAGGSHLTGMHSCLSILMCMNSHLTSSRLKSQSMKNSNLGR